MSILLSREFIRSLFSSRSISLEYDALAYSSYGRHDYTGSKSHADVKIGIAPVVIGGRRNGTETALMGGNG